MSELNSTAQLIPPYGGRLVNLLARDAERAELLEKAKLLPSIQISYRTLCDLELLAVGAFSPLDRFMGEKDYKTVLKDLRLSDGTLFPIPVTLPVDDTKGLEPGKEIALRGPTNDILAIMLFEDIYEWNIEEEATSVLGTTDTRHPLVAEMHTWGKYYITGPLTVLNLPRHYDFPELRKTPFEVREILRNMGYENVIAFQPRHPMYRPHEVLTKKTMEEVNGSLLIGPVVGMSHTEEEDHFTRVRCYKALAEKHYDPGRTLLSLLPLAARMAGPRAGLWHGIINRNYGVNHYIVGKDRIVLRKDSRDANFYDSRDVQRVFREHEEEIGVRMIPIRDLTCAAWRPVQVERSGPVAFDMAVSSAPAQRPGGDLPASAETLPPWLTRPEVARILQEVNPAKYRQGFCLWLTGLPSSGKSTIADILAPMLMARGKRVTLLDGDVIRTHLSKGLGFSREDRMTNILRVGFVAAQITKNTGVAICALISPVRAARDRARAMTGEENFFEVFVDTPLNVCEKRDVKGMYTLARRGKIKGFTGVDDDYEPPLSPEVRIDTTRMTPQESAEKIFRLLVEKGFIVED